MSAGNFEGLVLFVADLERSKAFYVDFLGLPKLLEDGILCVVGDGPTRIVLHRNDRGHDERGIWPAGDLAGGAALRFAVDDPDHWQSLAAVRGVRVLWPAQDASWGRFVLVEDPDCRPVALAKMRQPQVRD